MAYCIVTRYHGPTNYRGSRYIATGPSLTHGGPATRATAPFDYAGPGMDGNPRRAAELVAANLRAAGWAVTLGTVATLPDDSGYVFPLRYVTDDELACPHYDPSIGACSHRVAADMIGAVHA